MDKAACIKNYDSFCVCVPVRERENHVTSLKKQCVIVIRHCALNTTACALPQTKLFPEQECNGDVPVVLCTSTTIN